MENFNKGQNEKEGGPVKNFFMAYWCKWVGSYNHQILT